MRKLESEEYADFLSNKKSETARGALIGTAFEDVAKRIMQSHPNYDEDVVRNLALDTIANLVNSERKTIWPEFYSIFIGNAKHCVETRYENYLHAKPEIVSLDSVKHRSDDSYCMVEDCLDKVAKEQLMKLINRKCVQFSERDRLLLELKFKGNNGQGMTNSEVGRVLNITSERVRQRLANLYDRISQYHKVTNRALKVEELHDMGAGSKTISNYTGMAEDRVKDNISSINSSRKIQNIYNDLD